MIVLKLKNVNFNRSFAEKDYLNHNRLVRPASAAIVDTDHLNRPLFFERNEEKASFRSVRSDSIKPQAKSRRMGRAMRVIVVGGKKVGKTAILRQVACVEDITNKVSGEYARNSKFPEKMSEKFEKFTKFGVGGLET